MTCKPALTQSMGPAQMRAGGGQINLQLHLHTQRVPIPRRKQLLELRFFGASAVQGGPTDFSAALRMIPQWHQGTTALQCSLGPAVCAVREAWSSKQLRRVHCSDCSCFRLSASARAISHPVLQSAAALATSGPYTYTFQATGSYYFGCAVGTHCASGGMHLAVTVAA